MHITGIDEAGRGPILGPMAIVGFKIDKNMEDRLKDLGVRDSKELKRKRREKLYPLILEMGEIKTIMVEPEEIDSRCLTDIEAEKFAEVARELNGDLTYVDCVGAISFSSLLNDALRGLMLVVSHKADVLYPVVSAASIVAKVERDRAIDELAEEYGDIGSGYPADRRTINFLKKYVKENGCLPECARKRWRVKL
jgi:ribonuclease HII